MPDRANFAVEKYRSSVIQYRKIPEEVHMKRTLNGSWLFKSSENNEWKNAEVPGCNFLDLLRCGDIEDPFYSLGEEKVKFVGECDWEYKRSFNVTQDELDCDEIRLNFKMLDAVCDVYLNAEKIHHAENCFVPVKLSVKDKIKIGENELLIHFFSPVKYVREKYQKEHTPPNANGQNGIVHIRKPQCHFGWDWGPVLPLSGICDDCEIEFIKTAKIVDFAVTQHHENGEITVSVRADVKSFGKYKCTVELTAPDGEKQKADGEAAEFSVTNPELWQTYELSGKDVQPLYTVTVTLKSGNKIIDKAEKRIGLRTIELNRERDQYGKQFQFVLNGVPLFIKGSNYIPPDSFMTRYTKDKKRALIEAVRYSNQNMIRIWGGGYYADDELLEICDEMGILIWHDFQFACQAYPFFDSEFLENVKSEVKANVKRISSHPCLALWNGNNEIEDMHMGWASMKKYIDWTEKFFYGILEDEIRKYDPDTPYTQGSPIGISHNKGYTSDNVGDTHLWGVWHGLRPMTYYRSRMTRFCSEFGFESLPDMKTIEWFTKDKNYSLTNKEFLSHQKCANGNDKMVYYMVNRFKYPKHFKDFVYLSQLSQSECIRDATEHWRRNFPRCCGSMYWQLNDCWPVCSWSSIDYFGSYKALQYQARQFNAPLFASVEDTDEYIKIFAVNDFPKEKKIEIKCRFFDFENGTLKEEAKADTVMPLSHKEFFFFDTKKLSFRYNLKRTGIEITLTEDGEIKSKRVFVFAKEKNLLLPKAKLKLEIREEQGRIVAEVKSDKYARFVKLESSKSALPFSENFFDLLPGETRTVTMEKDVGMSIQEQMNSISVYSLCDVEPDTNPIKTLIGKTKVFFSPTNIGNAVYHGRSSTDVKID